MKKTILSVAMVCLLGTTMLTTPSCIGSFSLTNRLLGCAKLYTSICIGIIC